MKPPTAIDLRYRPKGAPGRCAHVIHLTPKRQRRWRRFLPRLGTTRKRRVA